MAYKTLTEWTSAICDAVREKEGSSGLIPAQDIPQRILDLSGGDEETRQIFDSISKNILDLSNSKRNTNVIQSLNDDGSLSIKDTIGIASTTYVGKFEVKKGRTYTFSSSELMPFGRFAVSYSNSDWYVINDTFMDSYIDKYRDDGNKAAIAVSVYYRYFTFTSKVDSTFYIWFCSDSQSQKHTSFTTKIQVEEGEKATEFMKYYSREELVDELKKLL